MECLLSLLTISRSRGVAYSYHFFSLTHNGVAISLVKCKNSWVIHKRVLSTARVWLGVRPGAWTAVAENTNTVFPHIVSTETIILLIWKSNIHST